uniref:Bestrophin homolog n=1 Tax=Ditylenchus dipsaci TaxID=166011 RepID=A0A915CQF4_9BILA
MTISYNLDVSSTSWKSFLRLLLRWRGSVWKAVFSQLIVWTFVYLIISLIYRFVLTEAHQKVFESLVFYFNTGIDSHIPLTFMLGFFVSFVVGRWGSILNGIGWIDNSAVCFATFIRGSDTETRILRRTLVRYMVLTQALVLRDISMQVRKRFPTLDTLEAAGLITKAELNKLDDIYDPYSRYWSPIQWCYSLLYDARLHGKIPSDHLLQKITDEIQVFRHGLSSLLKYDWVPIPLLYPQIIFFSVRLYFLICLVGRQFVVRPGALHRSEVDLWLPVVTMIQFTVYVGWMKVAEALLNPMGEDDDDLECNYVIDKNLITGLTLVDQGGKKSPDLEKDFFWNDEHVALSIVWNQPSALYIHSLDLLPSQVKFLTTDNVFKKIIFSLVKNIKTITMIPHKSKLSKMDEETQQAHVRIVNVEEHNNRHKSQRK